MSKEDSSISFGVGLLGGILGGLIAGILLAPKSGKETREELKSCVEDCAQKYAPQIQEAKKQALCSFDVLKFKLEKQYNKFNDALKAKNLAKAKEKEKEFNENY